MKVYNVFDIEDDEYIDNGGIEFKELQDLLYSEWQNRLYPDFDTLSHIKREIYSARRLDELKEAIEGLNYKVEEDEVND